MIIYSVSNVSTTLPQVLYILYSQILNNKTLDIRHGSQHDPQIGIQSTQRSYQCVITKVSTDYIANLKKIMMETCASTFLIAICSDIIL